MKKLFLLMVMVCCLQANAALRGDVNGDNNVDIADVNIVIDKILNLTSISNADVNGDGTTDVSDLNIVINIILGLDKGVEHEYVDLGLPGGVLWATCNVGAEKPEDYGLYFAWGETQGYARNEAHSFSWATYTLCDGAENRLTKYCTHWAYGTVDNKTQLEANDDAATQNWGSDWRMPTFFEILDLFDEDYTTTTWVTVNNVKGYNIKSKKNDKSIFLPAAGSRENTGIIGENKGYYWSSSLYTGSITGAYYWQFSSAVDGWDSNNRYAGQTVRPVRVNKAK